MGGHDGHGARKLVSGRLTISEASIWTFVKATAMRRQFGP